MNIPQIMILIIYVAIMLAIGYWSMKKTKNIGDFFLGGRSLGPWMSAFAYGTTYFSAVLFIGYAGKLGWGFGIYTMWIVVGNTVVGTLLAWKVLAGRTRDMTTRLNAITMPEFLSVRYNSKVLQVLAAIVIFVFLVPYSASVMMGLSYLFDMTLHIPAIEYVTTQNNISVLHSITGYDQTVIFLTILTGLYLVMGGYFAVAVSDFIRGIIEFVGVMIMVYLLADKVGGFAVATNTMMIDPSMAPGLAAKATKILGTGLFAVSVPGWLTLLSLVLITSFGPWSLPQMVQKFYSIRSKMDIKRAMIIASIFAVFMSFGAYYSGALTHMFYKTGLPPELMGPKGPIFDKIMPHFITTVGLPEVLVIVIVLMVFSASMSSLSSLVLVSSSAIAVDVYGAFVDRHTNQKRTMTLMRVLCGVFVGLTLYIALEKPTYIVNLMVISWSTLAGVFLAPYIYGLFWRRTTLPGVFAGIIVGLACAITLFIAWGNDGIPLAGAITMFLPMLVVPLVSLMTKPMAASHIEKVFSKEDIVTEASTGGFESI
jgi:Na+/proline symporter